MSSQAIENLSILLKVMYPKLHDGDLPNLEDMMEMLNDFTLVEEMCEKMKEDEELSKEYKMLLSYFKKNFYSDGVRKKRYGKIRICSKWTIRHIITISWS